jgi:hypothetical protein
MKDDESLIAYSASAERPFDVKTGKKRSAANFSLPARCLKSRAKVLRDKEERANESTDINQRLQSIKEHPCCSFFADALVSKKSHSQAN